MTFLILFMYAWVLAQLYVLCLRRTVTPSAIAHLFVVGAISSVALAYAVQSLLSHYLGASPRIMALRAVVEEIAKALPLVYVFFYTRARRSAGLLDGILCGAAVGAGFGFAEDAIYMIEHAPNWSASLQSNAPWARLMFAWLPGGWTRGSAFFAGHAVLGALLGGGIAAAGRLQMTRAARVAIGAAAFIWVAFLHASFNAPDAFWPWLREYGFGWLNGSGRYAKHYLAAAILLALVLEEREQARRVGAAPSSLMPRPLLGELAALMAAFGAGRHRGVQAARVLRMKYELFNLTAAGADETLRAAQAQRVRGAELAMPERAQPLWHPALKVRGALLVQPPQRALYFWLLLIVMAAGFVLVFVSPFLPHPTAQSFARSKPYLIIGLIGQVLVIWRCVVYLRSRPSEPEGGTAESVKHAARACLAWGGLLANAMGFKALYDLNRLPYPLGKTADVGTVIDQMRSCIGPDGTGASTGPATSPVPPMIQPTRKPPPPAPPTREEDDEVVSAGDPGLSGDSGAAVAPIPIRVGSASEDFGGGNADGAQPPAQPSPQPPRPLPDGPLGDPSDLQPEATNAPR